MNGEPINRNLIAITTDPFMSLTKLPATCPTYDENNSTEE
jgi:hypothetical protein